jgi:hypothetical protein
LFGGVTEVKKAISAIKAIVKGRRLDAPADWPDGTEVEIHPLGQQPMADADSMSNDENAKTLAAMDLVEPFETSDAEQAAWEAERRARKEREKAQFAEHGEKLRRMWE